MNSSLHFFAIPALASGEAQAELNRFLQQQRVVNVEKQWVADGAASYWSLCITVVDGAGPLPAALRAPGGPGAKAAPKVDYREVLSEADFAVFAELRNLRASIARGEGVPPYGKRHRPAVAQFVGELDANLNLLAHSILGGYAPQGRSHSFVIHDPKRRTITAACFADRVLHHALLNLAEPRLERMLVPSSYACRPGLGVHAAVLAVQRHLRRFAWVAQVDVAGYFPSIDHARLKTLLSRRFKGAGLLALLGRIIDAGSPGGVGLPIGSLTSQHFANAYLDLADRFLLNHPAVRAHVRYMDDILWCCDRREDAVAILAEFTAFLRVERGLTLKPDAHVGPSANGVRYCGFRVRPGVVLASARKLSRYRRHACAIDAASREGAYPDADLQRASDTAHATLAHTQTLGFRQRLWAQRAGV